MAISPPKIDERNQEKLVAELNLLLQYYIREWRNNHALQYDKQAQALVNIFARMMEVIIQRLNRVPEKNFLSFLDMIGVYLSPPKVARAPLTFTMAVGAKQFAFIKAGTQVATDQDETVIFETEKEVTVILPKLVKAISLDPQNDRWRDHSPLFFNNPSRTGEEIFRGQELTPHRLYLGHKRSFGFREPVTAVLKIDLVTESKFNSEQQWEVKWYCDQDGKRIPLEPFGVNQQNESDRNVANLLKSGTLYFPYLWNISETTLQGIETQNHHLENWKNHWLVAELQTPVTGLAATQLPEIKNVAVGIELNTPAIEVSGTISSHGLKVYGVKTKFNSTKENSSVLKANDRIIAQNQIRMVTANPESDTELTINEAFDPDLPEGTSFAYTPCATGTMGYQGKDPDGKDFYLYTVSTEVTLGLAPDTFGQEIKENQFIITGGETRVITKANPDNKTFYLDSPFQWNIPAGTRFYYVPGPPQFPVNAAFYNNNPLDISKDFRPFGERPKKLNDTFYIGSKEGFSKKGATVILNIQLSDGVEVNKDGVTLSWEFWNGRVWSRFDNDADYAFTDKTGAFTVTDNTIVSFKMPDNQSTTVNGVENYWLRIRIIDGGYGSPAQYFEQTANDNEPHYLVEVRKTSQGLQKYKIIDGTPVLLGSTDRTEWIAIQENFQPPSIYSITLSYMMPPEMAASENIITYNNFEYQDCSATGKNTTVVFRPFIPVSDEQAAVYLAFDQDIRSLPVNLFFPLLENSTGNINNQALESADPPVIAWEYWNGKKWITLSAEDGTENLTKREMVEFLIPDNMAKQYLFESELFWLRARLAKGAYKFLPKPWTICTNTVWGRHLTTVHNEILGSSNGKPNQTFKLNGSPVLPGQQIFVREPALTEAERAKILEDEGKDAIVEEKDQAGNTLEIWVRWHEVDSFHFSESNHRHYQIDRNTGQITFGDAGRGMIPPVDKNNIQGKFYQYGGGSEGNVKAGVITKLRTTFPYIDSVTNLEDADGGFDQENLERALVRGPQTLKHKKRAVTYEDFEWLVKEASTKVTKAKCLPATDTDLQYHPGWVTVIIVPESDDPKPYPSRELIRTVEEYLFDKTSTYLIQYPSQINLTGPGYMGIGVEVAVKYNSIGAAKIIEGKIRDMLHKYFHPLHGGTDGDGWDFGRNVYISEIYAAIENVEGVDHIVDLALKAPVQLYTLTTAMKTESITGTSIYPRLSSVKSEDAKIMMTLAEAVTLNPELPVVKMVVSGFKEGDRIHLHHSNDSISVAIKSVVHESGGDVLEFEPISSGTVFPVGSLVETSDHRIQSYILNQVPENGQFRYLKIATFEEKDGITIHRGKDDSDPANIKSGTVQRLNDRLETIYIDSHYLIYSGNHVIHSETNTGDEASSNNLLFPYMINLNTKEIHDLNHSTGVCNVQKKYRRFLETFDEQLLKDLQIDYCAYCFGRSLSNR